MILASAGWACGEPITLGPGGGGAELCAAIHPQNADILLLGQDVGGALKSVDGGMTWQHVNKGLTLPHLASDVLGIQELQFSPHDPAIVFAATWGGLFRSADTAESWTRVLPSGTNVASDFPSASAVAVSPDGRIVLVGTGDPFVQSEGKGLFRSTDGGLSFSPVDNSGILNAAIYGGIVFDSTISGPNFHALAATSEGLYRSVDGGLTFSKVNAGFVHGNLRDVAFGRNGTGKAFWVVLQTTEAGEGGVYRSVDGLSWVAATGNLPLVKDTLVLAPHALLVHPQDLATAYVTLRHGFDFSALYRTRDGGQSWKQLTPDEMVLGWNSTWGVWSYGGAISPANPARILLTNEAQPMLSNDGGETWAQVGTRQTPDGSWSTRGAEVTFAYVLREAPGHPQRIYAGYEDIGLWKSDNGGLSWSPIFLQIPAGGEIDACAELHVHPTEGNEFYAVASSWSNGLREEDSPAHLLHSTNAGATLVNLTERLDPGQGRRGCAAVDFSSPQGSRTVLFARHGQTVFRSTNGGGNWVASDAGFTPEHRDLIFALAFNPDDPRQACAGTHTEFGRYGSTGGVYRSSDGGVTWRKAADYSSTDVHFIGFRGSPKRLFVSGGKLDTDSGLFQGALEVSADAGQKFRPVLRQPFVMDVVEVPGAPSTLLAAAGAHYAVGQNQFAGIYRSTDNGESWERLEIELKHSGLLALMAPSWDPQRIFVGTRGDGVFAEKLPLLAPTGVHMRIQISQGSVEISWASAATNAVLQSAGSLAPGATWNNVQATVESRGDSKVVSLPITGDGQLFRLVRP